MTDERSSASTAATPTRRGMRVFRQADAPYAYSAGPEGLEILEFRGVSSFDMQITESLGRGDAILDVSRANKDRWATDAEAYS